MSASVLVAIAVICAVPNAVRADGPLPHQPVLLFDVSDEEMSAPLGLIDDIAVGTSGVVYLLDESNCDVRRIALNGDILPPLGRPGMGPGDLHMPQRMAVFPDGRCMVVQDFSKHVKCFDSDGAACPVVDISGLREGYVNTIYRRAAAGPAGALIISAITTSHRSESLSDSAEKLGLSGVVVRFRSGHSEPDYLFAMQSNTAVGDETAVVIRDRHLGFIERGWDINSAGEFLYADPGGSYGVVIGHPADGEAEVVELPEMPGDDQKVHELEQEVGTDRVPRIGSVYWLDDQFFMVVPAAEARRRSADRITTVEVFDRSGSSYGRFTIHCPFDPDNDRTSIEHDIVVVFRGGMSVTRASLGDFLPESLKRPDAAEVYEIRIRAYRLFGQLRGLN